MLNCANYAEIFNLVSTIQVDYALIQVLSTYIQSIKLKLRTMDIEYHPISRHKIAALIGPRNPLWALESVCTEQLNPYTILSWATSKQEAKYNYAEALGFIHTALGNLQTNNPKVFSKRFTKHPRSGFWRWNRTAFHPCANTMICT